MAAAISTSRIARAGPHQSIEDLSSDQRDTRLNSFFHRFRHDVPNLDMENRHERIASGFGRPQTAVLTRDMMEMYVLHSPDMRGMNDCLPVRGKDGKTSLGWRQKRQSWPAAGQKNAFQVELDNDDDLTSVNRGSGAGYVAIASAWSNAVEDQMNSMIEHGATLLEVLSAFLRQQSTQGVELLRKGSNCLSRLIFKALQLRTTSGLKISDNQGAPTPKLLSLCLKSQSLVHGYPSSMI